MHFLEVNLKKLISKEYKYVNKMYTRELLWSNAR